MSKFVTIVRTAVLVATVALSSVPAFASPAETAPTAKVSYSDLDLSSPEGQRHLKARLRTAAGTVCGVQGSSSSMISTGQRNCMKQALSRADTQFAAIVGGANQKQVAVADSAAGLPGTRH